MSELPVHSKTLTEAGRKFLSPMGLLQIGRSRTWLDDRTWWAIAVEFQPSSFSKGSSLNVGCMWLWHVKPYISFDVGSHVEGFIPFRDADSFTVGAERLAQRAAEKVAEYRKLFPDVGAVCRYFSDHRPADGWPRFNAAVALGLCANSTMARRLFESIEVHAESPLWLREMQADARNLAEIVGDSAAFRALIVTRILQTRALQKLPTIGEMKFGLADVS